MVILRDTYSYCDVIAKQAFISAINGREFSPDYLKSIYSQRKNREGGIGQALNKNLRGYRMYPLFVLSDIVTRSFRTELNYTCIDNEYIMNYN